MFGTEVVDTEAGVKEEVELRNDERGVPGSAGSASQDILLVRLRKAPFKNL